MSVNLTVKLLDSQESSAPQKKTAKSAASKKDNGDDCFLIANTKFATVREFKGVVYVDIREHYEKNGEMLPGKKGMLFSDSCSVSCLLTCTRLVILNALSCRYCALCYAVPEAEGHHS